MRIYPTECAISESLQWQVFILRGWIATWKLLPEEEAYSWVVQRASKLYRWFDDDGITLKRNGYKVIDSRGSGWTALSCEFADEHLDIMKWRNCVSNWASNSFSCITLLRGITLFIFSSAVSCYETRQLFPYDKNHNEISIMKIILFVIHVNVHTWKRGSKLAF